MSDQRIPTIALVLVVPVVAALAVLATSTLGGSGGGDSAATGVNEVVIENFEFSPDPARVPAGATLTVRNLDDAAHTLTADDGDFDTGELRGGARGKIEMLAAGRYGYYCTIHDYMTGVIRVIE